VALDKEAIMAQQSTAGKATPSARPEATSAGGAVVSVVAARRLVLVLLAFWTAIWGLSLILSTDAGTLTAGIEQHAAQRLLGVHVLILAPVYALLGWNPTKYRVFLWVPYASQAGVTLVTLFNLKDAALPFVVAVIFLALLLFLWLAGRKPVPALKAGGAPEGGASTGPSGSAPQAPKAK
jgi:hypothetical protein